MMYDDLAAIQTANAQTRFPVLREVMRQDLAHYADDDLVNVAHHIMPDVDLEMLEFSLGDLGRAIGPAMSQVGQVLGRAAPGVVSGALGGASAGAALGPYGMLAGAALGAVGGGVKSYQATRPQAAAAPARPAQVAVTRPATRPATRRPAQQPQALHPAVGQMLQLLSRPEILQAILAASAGALGRQTTQIAGQTVTTQAVLDALRMPVTDGRYDGEWAAGGAGQHVIDLLDQASPEAHPLLSALDADQDPSPHGWDPAWDPADYSPRY